MTVQTTMTGDWQFSDLSCGGISIQVSTGSRSSGESGAAIRLSREEADSLVEFIQSVRAEEVQEGGSAARYQTVHSLAVDRGVEPFEMTEDIRHRLGR